MEIVQRRFMNKIWFKFEEQKLKYIIKDSNGRQTFTTLYEDISDDVREMDERNSWYRNVGIFWVMIGVLQVIATFHKYGQFRGSLWLTLGIVCFLVYGVAKTRYSILPSDGGNILIIQDSKHDDIMHEILNRRKDQLRSLYGEIDASNNPEKEIEKFKLLHKQDIISEDEMKEKIDQIIRMNEIKSNNKPHRSEYNLN